MSKKKIIWDLFLGVLGSVVSYILNDFRLDTLLGIPNSVYVGLIAITLVMSFYWLILFIQKLSFLYFDSIQHISRGPSVSANSATTVKVTYVELYKDLSWEVVINVENNYLFGNNVFLKKVEGPLCPKDGCQTELSSHRTFFGRFFIVVPNVNSKKVLVILN